MWWRGLLANLVAPLLWLWSLLRTALRNVKSGFDPRSRRRRRLLSWAEQAAGRPVADLAALWRDPSLLANIVASPSDDIHSFAHLQELVFHRLLVPPLFSDEELLDSELSPALGRRLFRYLQSIKQAVARRQLDRCGDDDGEWDEIGVELFVADQYVARGVGLIMASRRRPAIFYVYSRDGSGLEDMLVEVRGPGGEHGSALVGSDRSQSQSQPITVSYRLTGEYLRVSYRPRSLGRHELSVSWHGRPLPGSPFQVTVDHISETQPQKRFNCIEWFSEDEEKRKIEVQERRKSARVICRVVDFVTEKMYLTEDGNLVHVEHHGTNLVHHCPRAFKAHSTPDPVRSGSLHDSISSMANNTSDRKERLPVQRPELIKRNSLTPQRRVDREGVNTTPNVSVDSSIVLEKCKRILNVCNYMLQHFPRQKSLEIVSGAGHILQCKEPSSFSRLETTTVCENDIEESEVDQPGDLSTRRLYSTEIAMKQTEIVCITPKNYVVHNITDDGENLKESLKLSKLESSIDSASQLRDNKENICMHPGLSVVNPLEAVIDNEKDSLTIASLQEPVSNINCLKEGNSLSGANIVSYNNLNHYEYNKRDEEQNIIDTLILLSEPSKENNKVKNSTNNNVTFSPFSKIKSYKDNKSCNPRNFSFKDHKQMVKTVKSNTIVNKMVAMFECDQTPEDKDLVSNKNLDGCIKYCSGKYIEKVQKSDWREDKCSPTQISHNKQHEPLNKQLQCNKLEPIGVNSNLDSLSNVKSKMNLFEKVVINHAGHLADKAIDKSFSEPLCNDTGIMAMETDISTEISNQGATNSEGHLYRARPALVVSRHYPEISEKSNNRNIYVFNNYQPEIITDTIEEETYNEDKIAHETHQYIANPALVVSSHYSEPLSDDIIICNLHTYKNSANSNRSFRNTETNMMLVKPVVQKLSNKNNIADKTKQNSKNDLKTTTEINELIGSSKTNSTDGNWLNGNKNKTETLANQKLTITKSYNKDTQIKTECSSSIATLGLDLIEAGNVSGKETETQKITKELDSDLNSSQIKTSDYYPGKCPLLKIGDSVISGFIQLPIRHRSQLVNNQLVARSNDNITNNEYNLQTKCITYDNIGKLVYTEYTIDSGRINMCRAINTNTVRATVLFADSELGEQSIETSFILTRFCRIMEPCYNNQYLTLIPSQPMSVVRDTCEFLSKVNMEYFERRSITRFLSTAMGMRVDNLLTYGDQNERYDILSPEYDKCDSTIDLELGGSRRKDDIILNKDRTSEIIVNDLSENNVVVCREINLQCQRIKDDTITPLVQSYDENEPLRGQFIPLIFDFESSKQEIQSHSYADFEQRHQVHLNKVHSVETFNLQSATNSGMHVLKKRLFLKEDIDFICEDSNIEDEQLDAKTQEELLEIEKLINNCSSNQESLELTEVNPDFLGTFQDPFQYYGKDIPYSDSVPATEKKTSSSKESYTTQSDVESIVRTNELNDHFDAKEFDNGVKEVLAYTGMLQDNFIQNSILFKNNNILSSESSQEVSLWKIIDQTATRKELNVCISSTETGDEESIVDRLISSEDPHLSISTDSDSLDSQICPKNEFGESLEAKPFQAPEFDSKITVKHEFTKNSEASTQEKEEECQLLVARTPSPSLRSLEQYFRDDDSSFDTDKFYAEISGVIIADDITNSITSLVPLDVVCSNPSENNSIVKMTASYEQLVLMKNACHEEETNIRTSFHENRHECKYFSKVGIEVGKLQSQEEEEEVHWIISPNQYPRVLLVDTSHMSVIHEEDSQCVSETTYSDLKRADKEANCKNIWNTNKKRKTKEEYLCDKNIIFYQEKTEAYPSECSEVAKSYIIKDGDTSASIEDITADKRESPQGVEISKQYVLTKKVVNEADKTKTKTLKNSFLKEKYDVTAEHQEKYNTADITNNKKEHTNEVKISSQRVFIGQVNNEPYTTEIKTKDDSALNEQDKKTPENVTYDTFNADKHVKQQEVNGNLFIEQEICDQNRILTTTEEDSLLKEHYVVTPEHLENTKANDTLNAAGCESEKEICDQNVLCEHEIKKPNTPENKTVNDDVIKYQDNMIAGNLKNISAIDTLKTKGCVGKKEIIDQNTFVELEINKTNTTKTTTVNNNILKERDYLTAENIENETSNVTLNTKEFLSEPENSGRKVFNEQGNRDLNTTKTPTVSESTLKEHDNVTEEHIENNTFNDKLNTEGFLSESEMSGRKLLNEQEISDPHTSKTTTMNYSDLKEQDEVTEHIENDTSDNILSKQGLVSETEISDPTELYQQRISDPNTTETTTVNNNILKEQDDITEDHIKHERSNHTLNTEGFVSKPETSDQKDLYGLGIRDPTTTETTTMNNNIIKERDYLTAENIEKDTSDDILNTQGLVSETEISDPKELYEQRISDPNTTETTTVNNNILKEQDDITEEHIENNMSDDIFNTVMFINKMEFTDQKLLNNQRISDNSTTKTLTVNYSSLQEQDDVTEEYKNIKTYNDTSNTEGFESEQNINDQIILNELGICDPIPNGTSTVTDIVLKEQHDITGEHIENDTSDILNTEGFVSEPENSDRKKQEISDPNTTETKTVNENILKEQDDVTEHIEKETSDDTLNTEILVRESTISNQKVLKEQYIGEPNKTETRTVYFSMLQEQNDVTGEHIENNTSEHILNTEKFLSEINLSDLKVLHEQGISDLSTSETSTMNYSSLKEQEHVKEEHKTNKLSNNTLNTEGIISEQEISNQKILNELGLRDPINTETTTVSDIVLKEQDGITGEHIKHEKSNHKLNTDGFISEPETSYRKDLYGQGIRNPIKTETITVIDGVFKEHDDITGEHIKHENSNHTLNTEGFVSKPGTSDRKDLHGQRISDPIKTETTTVNNNILKEQDDITGEHIKHEKSNHKLNTDGFITEPEISNQKMLKEQDISDPTTTETTTVNNNILKEQDDITGKHIKHEKSNYTLNTEGFVSKPETSDQKDLYGQGIRDTFKTETITVIDSVHKEQDDITGEHIKHEKSNLTINTEGFVSKPETSNWKDIYGQGIRDPIKTETTTVNKNILKEQDVITGEHIKHKKSNHKLNTEGFISEPEISKKKVLKEQDISDPTTIVNNNILKERHYLRAEHIENEKSNVTLNTEVFLSEPDNSDRKVFNVQGISDLNTTKTPTVNDSILKIQDDGTGEHINKKTSNDTLNKEEFVCQPINSDHNDSYEQELIDPNITKTGTVSESTFKVHDDVTGENIEISTFNTEGLLSKPEISNLNELYEQGISDHIETETLTVNYRSLKKQDDVTGEHKKNKSYNDTSNTEGFISEQHINHQKILNELGIRDPIKPETSTVSDIVLKEQHDITGEHIENETSDGKLNTAGLKSKPETMDQKVLLKQQINGPNTTESTTVKNNILKEHDDITGEHTKHKKSNHTINTEGFVSKPGTSDRKDLHGQRIRDPIKTETTTVNNNILKEQDYIIGEHIKHEKSNHTLNTDGFISEPETSYRRDLYWQEIRDPIKTETITVIDGVLKEQDDITGEHIKHENSNPTLNTKGFVSKPETSDWKDLYGQGIKDPIKTETITVIDGVLKEQDAVTGEHIKHEKSNLTINREGFVRKPETSNRKDLYGQGFRDPIKTETTTVNKNILKEQDVITGEHIKHKKSNHKLNTEGFISEPEISKKKVLKEQDISDPTTTETTTVNNNILKERHYLRAEHIENEKSNVTLNTEVFLSEPDNSDRKVFNVQGISDLNSTKNPTVNDSILKIQDDGTGEHIDKKTSNDTLNKEEFACQPINSDHNDSYEEELIDPNITKTGTVSESTFKVHDDVTEENIEINTFNTEGLLSKPEISNLKELYEQGISDHSKTETLTVNNRSLKKQDDVTGEHKKNKYYNDTSNAEGFISEQNINDQKILNELGIRYPITTETTTVSDIVLNEQHDISGEHIMNETCNDTLNTRRLVSEPEMSDRKLLNGQEISDPHTTETTIMNYSDLKEQDEVTENIENDTSDDILNTDGFISQPENSDWKQYNLYLTKTPPMNEVYLEDNTTLSENRKQILDDVTCNVNEHKMDIILFNVENCVFSDQVINGLNTTVVVDNSLLEKNTTLAKHTDVNMSDDTCNDEVYTKEVASYDLKCVLCEQGAINQSNIQPTLVDHSFLKGNDAKTLLISNTTENDTHKDDRCTKEEEFDCELFDKVINSNTTLTAIVNNPFLEGYSATGEYVCNATGEDSCDEEEHVKGVEINAAKVLFQQVINDYIIPKTKLIDNTFVKGFDATAENIDNATADDVFGEEECLKKIEYNGENISIGHEQYDYIKPGTTLMGNPFLERYNAAAEHIRNVNADDTCNEEESTTAIDLNVLFDQVINETKISENTPEDSRFLGGENQTTAEHTRKSASDVMCNWENICRAAGVNNQNVPFDQAIKDSNATKRSLVDGNCSDGDDTTAPNIRKPISNYTCQEEQFTVENEHIENNLLLFNQVIMISNTTETTPVDNTFLTEYGTQKDIIEHTIAVCCKEDQMEKKEFSDHNMLFNEDTEPNRNNTSPADNVLLKTDHRTYNKVNVKRVEPHDQYRVTFDQIINEPNFIQYAHLIKSFVKEDDITNEPIEKIGANNTCRDKDGFTEEEFYDQNSVPFDKVIVEPNFIRYTLYSESSIKEHEIKEHISKIHLANGTCSNEDHTHNVKLHDKYKAPLNLKLIEPKNIIDSSVNESISKEDDIMDESPGNLMSNGTYWGEDNAIKDVKEEETTVEHLRGIRAFYNGIDEERTVYRQSRVPNQIKNFLNESFAKEAHITADFLGNITANYTCINEETIKESEFYEQNKYDMLDHVTKPNLMNTAPAKDKEDIKTEHVRQIVKNMSCIIPSDGCTRKGRYNENNELFNKLIYDNYEAEQIKTAEPHADGGDVKDTCIKAEYLKSIVDTYTYTNEEPTKEESLLSPYNELFGHALFEPNQIKTIFEYESAVNGDLNTDDCTENMISKYTCINKECIKVEECNDQNKTILDQLLISEHIRPEIVFVDESSLNGADFTAEHKGDSSINVANKEHTIKGIFHDQEEGLFDQELIESEAVQTTHLEQGFINEGDNTTLTLELNHKCTTNETIDNEFRVTKPSNKKSKDEKTLNSIIKYSEHINDNNCFIADSMKKDNMNRSIFHNESTSISFRQHITSSRNEVDNTQHIKLTNIEKSDNTKTNVKGNLDLVVEAVEEITRLENDSKLRFERAKKFFQLLENSTSYVVEHIDNNRQRAQLNSVLPTIGILSKDYSLSECKKSRPRPRKVFLRGRKRGTNKGPSVIQSAPVSDTETSKRIQHDESFESFGGSVKIRKVSERFNVISLFSDVSEKVGTFRGTPNRQGLLASLKSVYGAKYISAYQMDQDNPKHPTNLGSIPSGFQHEYPYLPTTPVSKFQPRSDLGHSLIPRNQLLKLKFKEGIL